MLSLTHMFKRHVVSKGVTVIYMIPSFKSVGDRVKTCLIFLNTKNGNLLSFKKIINKESISLNNIQFPEMEGATGGSWGN